MINKIEDQAKLTLKCKNLQIINRVLKTKQTQPNLLSCGFLPALESEIKRKGHE